MRLKNLAYLGIGVLGVLAVVAYLARDEWDWLVADDTPKTASVTAPALQDVDPDSERLFRILPNGDSSVTYRVTERLAGNEAEAVGETTILAGDIAVNTEDPSKSRMGEIVVNVENFASDSRLRDKRIRHDFLESTHFPYSRFVASEINGLPTGAAEEANDLTITGDLTIKDVTEEVTFTGTARITDDVLMASASGELRMSDFDIGPIHVAGLAHTENDFTFELNIEASEVDATSTPDGNSELEVGVRGPFTTEGEFSQTVQPILEERCAGCHTEGLSGWNTVQMATAGDAAEIAGDIALVTAAKFMPPWPASDLSLEFEHDFSMTDQEIEIIQEWADAGGGLDVDKDTKLEPKAPPFTDIERDQVVPSNEAYVGSLDLKDDYRCQVHEFDSGDDGTWINGIAFEPDKLDVVHHSIIYVVPAEGREEVESLDGADGKPGWHCFGLSNLNTPGVRSIGGWAPGQQPRVLPDGVGIFMRPGDFIVNQIHYHFDHETPADQSVLVFDTLSPEEVEARPSPMTHITGNTYLTPAEGPCTPEESGPLCDRDAVLADIAEKYGAPAQFIPNALIGACGGDIEDFDKLDGTKFTSTCTLKRSGSGNAVLGARAHARVW